MTLNNICPQCGQNDSVYDDFRDTIAAIYRIECYYCEFSVESGPHRDANIAINEATNYWNNNIEIKLARSLQKLFEKRQHKLYN